MIIEEGVKVVDCLVIYIVDDNSNVFIGRGTTFEQTAISVADCGNSVVIGEDCMFARNTTILASDFHSIMDLTTGLRKNISKGVAIDNHVWIGYGAAILKNTHIYSNSIIGAGAVCHGEIFANSVYINGSKKIQENSADITWERSRHGNIHALKLYILPDRKQIDEIPYNQDILISLDNNFTVYFDKVQGWAVWSGKNSQMSELYLFCYFLKEGKEKNWVIPLELLLGADVVSYFGNDNYKLSRFDSYMPSEIINNWEYIQFVDIVMKNGSECGRKNIFHRYD